MTAATHEVKALARQGLSALQSGDAATARDLLRQAGASADDPGIWLNLAIAERMLGNEDEEWEALHKALVCEPRSLLGLLMKGEHQERSGKTADAAKTFGAAIMVAPPFPQVPANLKDRVRHAYETNKKWSQKQAEFLEAFLTEHISGSERRRFDLSIDVKFGKKSIYRQQPHQYYFPELPTVQFYDRENFPWLAEVEAVTEKIREEFLAVYKSDEGFSPYVDYPSHIPADQWSELNHSPRWNAFHLFKDGKRIEDNCKHCPVTMDALAKVPAPALQGRTPSAMYSVLSPGTRIPPHTGVTNCRLVVHLPLVVPQDCGFRVGNETREWNPGKALIFNDTIEHEAWNNSDEVRAVLIFDIWHPQITEPEREMIQTLYRGLDEFDISPGVGAVD